MRFLKTVCFCLFVAFVFMALAGCADSGGDSSSTTGNKTYPPAAEESTPVIEKVSGDAQQVPMGTASPEPLTVGVTDGDGAPLAGKTVYFSVQKGAAGLNGSNSWVFITTGADGTASASATPDAAFGEITVTATCSGAGSVAFNITPRLPTLGEVAYGSNAAFNINDLPAILADVEGAGRALVLLTGESDLDLTGLPAAGNLLGAAVAGVQAGDLPVALMPAEKLVDSSSFSPPAAGSLSGSFIAGNKAEDMPASLPDYSVNSESVVMLIKGASSIPGAMPLSDLLAANPKASDLTVRVIEASDYPAVQIASADYIALDEATLPVFSGSREVVGSSVVSSVPVAGVTLPASNLSLVDDLEGSVAPAVRLEPPEKPMKTYAPEGAITAIPPDYREAVSIVRDEIVPLSQSVRPIMDEQRALMEQLGQTLQDNVSAISDLLNGNINDLSQLGSLVGALPTIDRMLQNQLEMLPVQAQQLDVIRNELIPSVESALEGNDITFGGAGDGEASSVLNDVLPFIDGELGFLQNSMPMIEELVADIESLIPDNGNLLSLAGNAINGGLDEILADLDALMPNLVSGLRLFNDEGIPILYDALEQAEADIQPGDMQVSDTRGFDAVVGWMSSELSQDTTLGELPGFDMWGDMVADFIPPEWGDPAGVSIFDDVIPAIGNMDVAEDVLPVLRDGLDAMATSLPGVISALEGFSFLNISIDFGF